MNTQIDVALILWNPDVIQLVEVVLEDRHLICTGIEPSQGMERIEDLIATCNPNAVVFDIGPPYLGSIALSRRLLDRFPDLEFMFTCADVRFVTAVAPWLCVYPILQKPYEPDKIGEVILSMVNRSPGHAAGDRKMTVAGAGR